MKTLNNYLNESLLDDFDVLDSKTDKMFLNEIKEFIKTNFDVHMKLLKISKYPNSDGKYEVDAADIVHVRNSKRSKLQYLTNGNFIWTKVTGGFDCWKCRSLKTLEGGPKEVSGVFNCEDCNSLTSLKGAPEKVSGTFYCSNCDSLKTLEGGPKEVGGNFYCYGCDSLTSLEGAPKKLGGELYCWGCNSLKNYKTNSNIEDKLNMKVII